MPPIMDQSLHRSEYAGCHGTGRVRVPPDRICVRLFRTPAAGANIALSN